MKRQPRTDGRLITLRSWRAPGGAPRRVRAWIPGGPAVGPRPVLLLFDGQNVFGDEGSYAGGWNSHAATQALRGRVLPPVVIGVDHGGARRVDELGHHVRDTVAAVAHDLVPRLRRQLDWPVPSAVCVGGASLGGLAALHAAFEHPEVFGRALAMSPSLWFDHRRLVRDLMHGALTVPTTTRLYLDAGARERGRMFADAESLASWLAAHGLGPDRLMWRPDRRGAHSERHWRRRLPKALRFLFHVDRLDLNDPPRARRPPAPASA